MSRENIAINEWFRQYLMLQSRAWVGRPTSRRSLLSLSCLPLFGCNIRLDSSNKVLTETTRCLYSIWMRFRSRVTTSMLYDLLTFSEYLTSRQQSFRDAIAPISRVPDRPLILMRGDPVLGTTSGGITSVAVRESRVHPTCRIEITSTNPKERSLTFKHGFF